MHLLRTFEFFSLATVTFAVTIAIDLAPSQAVSSAPTSLQIQRSPVVPISIETNPNFVVSNLPIAPQSAPSLSAQTNIAKSICSL